MSFPTWTRSGPGLGNHRGLAPLGLEPVASRFVDDLMPGITNSTWNVRYYSFYSWVLWTFLRQAEKGVFPRTAAQQAWWLGRMENLFRFTTLISNPAKRGIVGVEEARTIPLPLDDPEALVPVGRALKASGFVPAYYKSSFLALGCGEADGAAVDLTLSTGFPLAQAFDRCIRSTPGVEGELERLLAPSDTIPMRTLQVFSDALALRDVPPGDPENERLLDLFFRIRQPREVTHLHSTDRARTRSYALLLELLRQAERPLSLWDYHAIFASAHLPGARRPRIPATLTETWTCWHRYQEREHERVALYALLYVLVEVIPEHERRLGGATARSLTEALWTAADESEIVLTWLDAPLSSWTVADAQATLLERVDRTGMHEQFSVEALSLYVQDAKDRGEITGGALLLLLLETGLWEQIRDAQPEWARHMHRRGGLSRLSLESIVEEVKARHGELLRRFMEWVVEAFVLWQAIRVAADKLANGDYRFFIAMGDDGYTVARRPRDGRLYYPPRIETAFHMLAELGALESDEDGSFLLTPHGEAWLDQALECLAAEAGG
jgi:hypothetical protein